MDRDFYLKVLQTLTREEKAKMQRTINKRMKALVGSCIVDSYTTYKFLITGYITDEADDVSVLVSNPSKPVYTKDDLLSDRYLRIEKDGSFYSPFTFLYNSETAIEKNEDTSEKE